MLILALTCAVITAALIAIVSLWHRHVRPVDSLSHARTLYADFVADVERRESKGEIDADLANEERVEAARGLLKAEDNRAMAQIAFRPWHAGVLTTTIAALTFGLYLLVIGHPYLADQPYAPRLKQWTAASQLPACQPAESYDARLHAWLGRSDPGDIPEAQGLAAVVRHEASSCKDISVYWIFLGRIDKFAGNFYASARDFETARDLSPKTFTAWSDLGEALTLFTRGDSSADARRAFEMALRQDANDVMAHYYLGRSDLTQGNYDAARTHFSAALARLSDTDSRRQEVMAELNATRAAQSRAEKPTGAPPQVAAMVAALEAQLVAQPENPGGWARLLRSYEVLNNPAGKAKALAAMRAHYRGRPELADDIVAKSQGAVGAEDTGGQ